MKMLEHEAQTRESTTGETLWEEAARYLQETHGVEPIPSGTRCSAAKGWKVRQKGRGKTICTLYPLNGFFRALIAVHSSNHQMLQPIIAEGSAYVKKLFDETPFQEGKKWLMIDVTNEAILRDLIRLIELRIADIRIS